MMPREAVWVADTPGLFTAALARPVGGRQYLVVERMPGGGWDWVAWRADRAARPLNGNSETAAAAMRAAERALVFLAAMVR